MFYQNDFFATSILKPLGVITKTMPNFDEAELHGFANMK